MASIRENNVATLGSIHIRQAVHQPAASDMTYIGLAALVPVELRALCTCAGLFFARVYGEGKLQGGQEYYLEIAALPHYFDAQADSRQKHIRTMTLSATQFALLVEYDRHLAGMPTCDVRELVIDHATAQGYYPQPACHTSPLRPTVSQVATPAAGASSTSPTLRQTAQIAQTAYPSQPSALLWREGPTLTVPLALLRTEAQAAFQEPACSSTPSPVPFTVLVLRAALNVLTAQRQQETDQRERKRLTRQLREVRRVLVARREIPPKIAVTPLYQPGKARGPIGCTVSIGVPLALVA